MKLEPGIAGPYLQQVVLWKMPVIMYDLKLFELYIIQQLHYLLWRLYCTFAIPKSLLTVALYSVGFLVLLLYIGF